MSVTHFETLVLPVVIALLTGGGIGAIFSARVAARKNNLDELRGIIAEQQRYIDRLEASVANLQTRADSLAQRVAALECENGNLRREMGE